MFQEVAQDSRRHSQVQSELFARVRDSCEQACKHSYCPTLFSAPHHDDEHLLLDSVSQEDVELLDQFIPAHPYQSLKYEQETLHNIARKLKRFVSRSLRDQEMR